MKVQGKITKILEKVTGQKKDGSGEWAKQNFVVTTDEQYNNRYCFEVFGQEKVDNLTKFNKVGDEVEVEFNVQTNEWEGKYYTSLQAWKIKKVAVPEAVQETNQPVEEDDGDLPF